MDKRDGDGYFQLYTLNPDGSGLSGLTERQVEGGPKVDRHKGFAHYHPSGRYLVVQVEMAKRLVGDSKKVTKASEPGSAVWNDLWVASADGLHWTNLTNFSAKTLTGALSPYFSHDGTKLLYAHLTKGADRRRLFGYWELYLADFSLTPAPHLSNNRVLLSGEGIYEPHGFSPDDGRILFSADRSLDNSLGLDLWEYTLASGALRNLTRSPAQYDEHARYSPDGKFIAWGSSQCCSSYKANLRSLISEAYAMPAEGGPAMQITHFNAPGYPESSDIQSGGWPTAWSPDGRRLVISQQLLGLVLKGRDAPNPSWLVTFESGPASPAK